MTQKRLIIGISLFFTVVYALQTCTLSFPSLATGPTQRKVRFGAKSNSNVARSRLAFQDYPVTVATVPFAPPNFSGTTDRYNKYRTAIKLAANAGPNFAGHFTIVEIGCGTSCAIPFIVDLSDGKVSELPHEIGIIPDITYEYRRGSTLLVALWPLDVFTSKPRCKRVYYQRISDNFVKIEDAIALGECHS